MESLFGPLTLLHACSSNDPVADAITAETGLPMIKVQSIGSSGWSSQLVYTAEDGTNFFAKMSRKSAADMFQGEALGLEAMYGALQCAAFH